jgi:NAD(P)H-hydrate epimerase
MAILFNAEQVKAWDLFTILHTPIHSFDLMERAAHIAAQSIINRYPKEHPKVIVVCGRGNNGGDGFGIARLLLDEGFSVRVFFLEGKRSADNQYHLNRLQEKYADAIEALPAQWPKIENIICIDAVLGSGLKSAATGQEEKAISLINSSGMPVFSIDLPSGLSMDTWIENASVVNADFTLSFQQYKKSFLFPETGMHCGDIEILDIQLSPDFKPDETPTEFIIDLELVQSYYKTRNPFSHKGTYGHALLLAGSKGMMGAATLTAKACLRSGAGRTTLWIPESEVNIPQVAVPESTCISYSIESPYPNLSNYQAIGAGPGLGHSDLATKQLNYLLENANQALILDADAINSIAANPRLFSLIPEGSLLTPHPKEFDRLFGQHENSFARNETQRRQSIERKIFILLKGKYSCLSTPEGLRYYNVTGNAGMAKGGSGDALTGMITALYAQYKNMQQSAILGMYLHGVAGDLASKRFSEESMLASDLIEEIGNAFTSSFGTF